MSDIYDKHYRLVDHPQYGPSYVLREMTYVCPNCGETTREGVISTVQVNLICKCGSNSANVMQLVHDGYGLVK
jgi:hypothetical protein